MVKYSSQGKADATKVWYYKSPTDILKFECPARAYCRAIPEVLLPHNAKY